MKKTLYIYVNLLTSGFNFTDWNMWTTEEEKKTGLYRSEHASWQLLEVREIEFDAENFDLITGKIIALETELERDKAKFHVRQENLKAQIQELKCIGHDVLPKDEGPAFDFDDDLPL